MAALSAAVVGATSPAWAAKPDPAPVALDCKVNVDGSWETGETFNAEVQPNGPLRAAKGPVNLQAPDGTTINVKSSFLRCRRDGGLVPETNGANIADFTGNGTFKAPGQHRVNVTFQAHVEDRGETAERNRLDYFAIRVLDIGGNEIYFNANYLATGSVRLIPVG